MLSTRLADPIAVKVSMLEPASFCVFNEVGGQEDPAGMRAHRERFDMRDAFLDFWPDGESLSKSMT